ncbi:monoacylglycerol lipase abhd6-A-like [Saccoglossus kowalevskii]|uniref:acylglycerol lipase n=1 Tax=Saccoglossus kowalevskii TaxID=10224 RepID=A0ABM0M861_SACKO|nr:PREDICTED: monoacylglycerol lipase abhd6-A-like [Saccoglossus kowalevskii]
MMSFVITILFGVMLLLIMTAFYLYYINPQIIHWMFTRIMLYRAGLCVKYLYIGDYRYCYAEKGNGTSNKPTMLFLHGFSSSKDMYCTVVTALAKDLHIILLDMPGHGYTTQKVKDDHSFLAQANKVHQFVEAYGLDKSAFHLCGTSMGGAVAGIYAALYPHHLVKLTLVCPAGILTRKLSKYVEILRDDEVDLLRPDSAEGLEKMLDIVMHKKLKIPNWYLKIANAIRKPHSEFYMLLMEEMKSESARNALKEKLKDIRTETQVIWGVCDEIIDVSGANVIKEALGDLCRVDLLDNCGHSVELERPYRTAKVMMEFVNS